MNRYEQLKSRQRAALIVVCTLGLAAVPIALNWNSNIFAGTSLGQGPLALFFKVLSFLFLTALFAVPAFFIYLIALVVTTIELSHYSN
jgi:hypothetical protein